MRDRLAPPDRFFSTTAGTSVGAHNRAVDAPQLVVDLSLVDECDLQALESFVQRAIGVPRMKQAVDRFPRAEFVFRQVAPRRSRLENPQNPVHDQPPIGGGTTR